MEQDRRTSEQTREAAGLRQRNRYLALIATVLGIAALKLSKTVTLPLAFALFLIAIFWPLQKRLERRLPKGAAVVVTLLCFLGAVAALVGALSFAADSVARKAPQYAEQARQLMAQVQHIADRFGLSSGSGSGGGASRQQLFLSASSTAFALVAGFILVMTYLVLGLLEVHDYRAKLDDAFGEHRGSRFLDVIYKASSDFQRYVVVRGGVALLTGLLVFTFSLVVGLDFAFIWGLTTFILEFVPTVGTMVAMVPPMLFGLFQFGATGKALLVALGLGGIQLVMGQFVEPLVEGKYLELSPIVVLVAIAFWGWLWGVAGAFIALPLTIMVVLVCRQFESTRWLATLLSSRRKRKE